MKDADMGPGLTEVRRSFAPESSAVAEVRRFVLDAWDRATPRATPARGGDVQLVVSELATNAVRHAGGEFHVVICWTDDVVRFAVDDGGAGRPAPVDPDGSSVGGRGLRIVELLADRWGVDEVPGGKSVWAEFRLR